MRHQNLAMRTSEAPPPHLAPWPMPQSHQPAAHAPSTTQAPTSQSPTHATYVHSEPKHNTRTAALAIAKAPTLRIGLLTLTQVSFPGAPSQRRTLLGASAHASSMYPSITPAVRLKPTNPARARPTPRYHARAFLSQQLPRHAHRNLSTLRLSPANNISVHAHPKAQVPTPPRQLQHLSRKALIPAAASPPTLHVCKPRPLFPYLNQPEAQHTSPRIHPRQGQPMYTFVRVHSRSAVDQFQSHPKHQRLRTQPPPRCPSHRTNCPWHRFFIRPAQACAPQPNHSRLAPQPSMLAPARLLPKHARHGPSTQRLSPAQPRPHACAHVPRAKATTLAHPEPKHQCPRTSAQPRKRKCPPHAPTSQHQPPENFPNDSSAQAPPPSPLSPSHPSTQEPSQISTQAHPTRPSHHALALSPHAPTPPRPSLHAHQPKLPSSHAHPSPRMNGLKPHADTHVRAPTDSRPTLTQAPPRPNLNPSILSARQLSPSIQPAHACPSPCPLVYPPKYPLVHSSHPKAM